MPATAPRTEAQIAASRANGTKSRGPRTEQGKSRSRLNGLTHGLRAHLPVLPGEDPEALEARRRAWHDDLRPIHPTEAYLVDHAVAASMALDRGRRSEAAAIAGRLEALDDPDAADDRARADAESAAADLPIRPADALARLRATPAGCRLLIGRWSRLADELDRAGFWPIARRRLALNLLGLHPADTLDDPAAYRLIAAGLSAEWGDEATIECVTDELAPARPPPRWATTS